MWLLRQASKRLGEAVDDALVAGVVSHDEFELEVAQRSGYGVTRVCVGAGGGVELASF